MKMTTYSFRCCGKWASVNQ